MISQYNSKKCLENYGEAADPKYTNLWLKVKEVNTQTEFLC